LGKTDLGTPFWKSQFKTINLESLVSPFDKTTVFFPIGMSNELSFSFIAPIYDRLNQSEAGVEVEDE